VTDTHTKTRIPRVLRFLVTLLRIVLFIPVQLVFIPFAVIGLAIGIYKGLLKSKTLGVSFSACRALQYKWFMHYFDVRPDPLSVAFIKRFPCESQFGLWSTFGALIVSQRLFGLTTGLGRLDAPGEETFFSFAGPRVLAFDRIMETHVDHMEQVVIPGAGFDLIAQRYTKGKDVKVFELDQVETLYIKQETLRNAGMKHDWITYVPVDYSCESWADKLLRAGFDRTAKTLFLWQSVSLFLEADVVRDTLRHMADLCADGSVIAQDFYSEAFISGEASPAVKRAARMIEKREPWRFGIDMSGDPNAAVRAFLKECGLRATTINQFGERLDIEPFYCVVEAVKQ